MKTLILGISVIAILFISISCKKDKIKLPVVETMQVSVTGVTSAQCGGNVISDGGSPVTSRGVCWSIAIAPTIAGNKTINGSGTGTFTSNIAGLISDTVYFFRAYATNEAGTGYGEELSFRTLVAVP